MRRQARIPGVAELFQTTTPAQVTQLSAARSAAAERDTEESPHRVRRSGAGRRRHDEKITVYLSSSELVALEEARLALRAQHGIAVDRGRLVREAIDIALADLAERGDQSVLIQRLVHDEDAMSSTSR